VQLIADPILSSLPLAPVRQDQGARRHQRQARAGRAGDPDRRRIRHDRIRLRLLVWAVGPKGLPADIVAKLQAQVAAIVVDPQVKSRLALLASSRSARARSIFARYIDDEMAKYAKIIKDAHIKAE